MKRQRARAAPLDDLWGNALELAAWAGLLLQGAVAVALLRVWVGKQTSFYLVNLGGAGTPVYVAELVASPLAFVLLALGRRREAESFAALAGVLALVGFSLNTHLGRFWVNWQLTAGMTLLGVVPALCLLASSAPSERPARPALWLGAVAVLAVAASLSGQSLLRFVNGAWLAAAVIALVTWWRFPRGALAVAVLSIPVLVLSSAHRVVPYGGTLPAALPIAVAVLLVLLGILGERRLR